jgi:hypothetical protein
MKDEEGQWFVTAATMTVGGKTVAIPVKSFIWKKW